MKARYNSQQIVGAIFLSLLLLQTACTTPPPPPVVIAPIIVPTDSDQDGIFDTSDLCPDTAAGVVVNSNGCPRKIDKDRDGVDDAQDACPGTPKKTEVDAKGCPLIVLPEPSKTCSLEYLPSEGDEVLPSATEMKKMNDFINENPGRRFIIEGHTDNIGNEYVNMKRSLLRAEKIKTYLTQKMGIAESMIEARGFGESNPIADNSTQEGRQQNRRIVIIALTFD